jgi:hypothetical protein
MFENNMTEAQKGRVLLEDVEPDVFKQLLSYMYSGKVRLFLFYLNFLNLFFNCTFSRLKFCLRYKLNKVD